MQVLKGLEGLCSPGEFKELCFFLTLSSIREHAEYRSWTPAGGRYAALTAMLEVLQHLCGPAGGEEAPAGAGAGARLELLLRRAVRMQAALLRDPDGALLLGEAQGDATALPLPLLRDVECGDLAPDRVVAAVSPMPPNLTARIRFCSKE